MLVLLCMISAVANGQGKNKTNWKLVWEENFNQNAGIDTTKWSKIPRGRSDWNNYMSDFEVGPVNPAVVLVDMKVDWVRYYKKRK